MFVNWMLVLQSCLAMTVVWMVDCLRRALPAATSEVPILVFSLSTGILLRFV